MTKNGAAAMTPWGERQWQAHKADPLFALWLDHQTAAKIDGEP